MVYIYVKHSLCIENIGNLQDSLILFKQQKNLEAYAFRRKTALAK